MSKRDKILIVVFIIALAALVTKSFVFDEYKPKNEAELNAFEEVTMQIDNDEKSWLEDTILTMRIVSMRESDDGYRVKVRKYLFGFFAYGEFRVDFQFGGGN